MLGFHRSTNGTALAISESRTLSTSYANEWTRLMAYLAAVDIGGAAATNRPLRQAQREIGNPPSPDLYWWDVNGVGVFYTFDGTDTRVVLMRFVANPPSYGDLLTTARGRV